MLYQPTHLRASQPQLQSVQHQSTLCDIYIHRFLADRTTEPTRSMIDYNIAIMHVVRLP